MWMRRTATSLLTAAVGLCASGVLLGATCSSEELRAVVSGLEAVARAFDDAGHDDITFGEWFLSEFDD